MLQRTCEFARQEEENEKRNAFFESWGIHARNLLSFFYSPTDSKYCPRPDDVIAEDFFDNDSKWRTNRPDKSQTLIALAKRIGKEVAHLTYVRVNYGSVGPKWPISIVTNEMRRIILKFYELVPSDWIGPEFKKFFKILN